MASDDQANPYEQPSHWPRMRQAPMRLGPLPKATPRPPGPPAAAPEPAPPPLAPEPAVFFGPTSRSTHPVAPPAIRPGPIEALVRAPYPELRREPEPEPARPEILPDPPRDLGDLGELDLAIPTPEPAALVVPITSRRTKARTRQSSRLVPILAASVVAIAGAGVLVLLMNAGQQAAAPARPLPVAVAAAPLAPVAETAAVAPPPLASAAPTPAPAATPAPRRVASTVRAPPPPSQAPVAAEPASVLEVPPPEAEGPRITIPPPEVEPAPAPPPVARAPPPGPDQPMATHIPD